MSDEFDPKIIGYLCNWCHSAFFFEAKFSTGSGSQRKQRGIMDSTFPRKTFVFHRTWGKKKLALTCSNFAFYPNTWINEGVGY